MVMQRKTWIINSFGSDTGMAVYFAFTLHRLMVAKREFAFEVMRKVSDDKKDQRERNTIDKIF